MSINNQAKIASQSLDNLLGKSLTVIIDAVESVQKYFFSKKMDKEYEHINENNNHVYIINGKKISLDDLFYSRQATQQQVIYSNQAVTPKEVPASYKKLKQLWE
jgi:hypothetical protein